MDCIFGFGGIMKIGHKLKLLRKERKMTLKELSEKSGVAIATLSRMEHNIMTGTLASHMSICKELGVSLADFYREVENESKDISVIKEKEKHDSFVNAKKSAVEILTTKVMSKKMMPTLMRIAKGGQTHKDEYKPGSEKFVYVLKGSVTAKIGKEEHVLSEGDSLYFDASLPHSFANSGKTEATALSIMSPPEI